MRFLLKVTVAMATTISEDIQNNVSGGFELTKRVILQYSKKVLNWNTLGISNQIKRVFLMWIKMFNIGF